MNKLHKREVKVDRKKILHLRQKLIENANVIEKALQQKSKYGKVYFLNSLL